MADLLFTAGCSIVPYFANCAVSPRGPSSDDRPPWYEGGRPEPAWRSLFAGRQPQSILRRLIQGDPLELFPLGLDRMSELARVIHPHRLFFRCTARVAHAAALGYNGKVDLYDWLEDLVDRSIHELIAQDEYEEAHSLPLAPEDRAEFAELIPKATGIEPGLARRATVVLNAMTLDLRRAFLRVAIFGIPVEVCAEEESISVDECIHRVTEATRILVLRTEGADPQEGVQT